MEKVDGGFVSNVIRGVFSALIVTLLGVLIFAVVIKVAYLNTGVVKAVNQFIKILAIFLGCSFSLGKKMGLISGAFVGGFATAITYLLFSLFGAQTAFGFSFAIDIIFSVIVGAFSGVITANLKNR